jgi:hypothetical protein
VQGLAQFFVLFAGPIGLALLAAFVVLRWLIQSRRRREREAPRLEVIEGEAKDEAREPAEPTHAERPSLRVVSHGRSGARREGP